MNYNPGGPMEVFYGLSEAQVLVRPVKPGYIVQARVFEGALADIANGDLYHRPENLFVAGFIGAPSMNYLDVEMVARNADSAKVRSDLVAEFAAPVWREGIASSGPVRLGIRPQDLRPVETGGILQGTVTLAERLGIETVVDIALKDGTRVLCSMAEDRVIEPGQAVALDFDPARAHVFAAEAQSRQAA